MDVRFGGGLICNGLFAYSAVPLNRVTSTTDGATRVEKKVGLFYVSQLLRRLCQPMQCMTGIPLPHIAGKEFILLAPQKQVTDTGD